MSNHQNQDHGQTSTGQSTTKKRRLIDKVCPYKILEIIPESTAYHEMFAFERKLDLNISRIMLDIQEALKRPVRIKKTLRIFISNLFYTHQDTGAPSWELRIEGRLTENLGSSQRRKFSSFFKSLVIELDSAIYGPDHHLIEWIRTPNTRETDGFQVRRGGDLTVKCTILLQLEHQPHQFKLDKRLAKLLGRKADTRPGIIAGLWQYIKSKSLQDANDRECINNDRQLKQIFECKKMKFSEIPAKLNCLISPPEPIIIHHNIVRGIGETQRSIYELDVEIEDLSTNNNNSQANYNNIFGNNTYSSSNNNINSSNHHHNYSNHHHHQNHNHNHHHNHHTATSSSINSASASTNQLNANQSSNTNIYNDSNSNSHNNDNSSSHYSNHNHNNSSSNNNNNNNNYNSNRYNMETFTMSTANNQELQQLDEKMCDTLEAIKLTRNTFDLFTSFAKDPYLFTNRWLASQAANDLNKQSIVSTSSTSSSSAAAVAATATTSLAATTSATTSTSSATDNSGDHISSNGASVGGSGGIDSEETQRRAEYYYQPWLQQAVCRYFYRKLQERRGDLDVTDGQAAGN